MKPMMNKKLVGVSTWRSPRLLQLPNDAQGCERHPLGFGLRRMSSRQALGVPGAECRGDETEQRRPLALGLTAVRVWELGVKLCGVRYSTPVSDPPHDGSRTEVGGNRDRHHGEATLVRRCAGLNANTSQRPRAAASAKRIQPRISAVPPSGVIAPNQRGAPRDIA